MKNIVFITTYLFTLSLCAQNNPPSSAEYFTANNYGGKVELKRFFQQELYYPSVALNNKVEGTVELAFIIDVVTGKRSDLHVKKSISKELDEEAIRLYKMLCFETPPYRGGKSTKYSTLKVKFSIKNYKRYTKQRGYTNSRFNVNENDTSMIIYKDNRLRNKPQVIFEDSLENVSRFIYNNLKYPEGTYRLNLKGTVKYQFVVEPTGRITNLRLIKGLGGGATNETERLLKLLKWKPGKLDEKKVRVMKEFEVNFNLSNNEGHEYVPNSNF